MTEHEREEDLRIKEEQQRIKEAVIFSDAVNLVLLGADVTAALEGDFPNSKTVAEFNEDRNNFLDTALDLEEHFDDSDLPKEYTITRKEANEIKNLVMDMRRILISGRYLACKKDDKYYEHILQELRTRADVAVKYSVSVNDDAIRCKYQNRAAVYRAMYRNVFAEYVWKCETDLEFAKSAQNDMASAVAASEAALAHARENELDLSHALYDTEFDDAAYERAIDEREFELFYNDLEKGHPDGTSRTI